MGKKTIAKVFQISDILQWHEKGELELSPKYQRNSVWNEKAKSYLIDTIVRGLPIPPIFLRQQTDIATKKTFREIIDGQQRVRSIIEYVIEEKFSIKAAHNKEFADKYYEDLDDSIKEQILEYEIVSEVITEKDDTVIYDMFARLNSNNIVLNKQEIRNSKFWGDFKVFVYLISSEYREFFSENKIFKDNDFSRMKDIELMNSLIILFLKGIVTEPATYVDNIYKDYDKEFSESPIIESKIRELMRIIKEIFLYFQGNQTVFENKNHFYTLFATLAHQMYGLAGIDDIERNPLFKGPDISEDGKVDERTGTIKENIEILKEKLIYFINIYVAYSEKDDFLVLNEEENKLISEFVRLKSIRTTSKKERLERIKILSTFLELN